MAAPDPRVGTVLHDRYLVLERVTEGSMGVVYRGERVKLKRPVAIKFLSEGYAGSPEGVRRFEVEARAMSRLAHPNCVGVIDFGLDHGAPYLVMDFIIGRTLREVLRAEWRMPPERAFGIVRQVLAGLAHAHGHRIVHRDVKPENILLTPPVEGHGEQVRILDFGLAKLRDEGSITTGVAVGTPGYMSPEQTMGEKVDERTDVYATGIILFELLTGQKPFKTDNVFEMMRMHREVPPPRLGAVAPDLSFSPSLDALVQQALAKSREERVPTAAAFLAALEALPEARGQRERKPWPIWRIGAGAGVIAAVALGAVLWAGRSKGTPQGAALPRSTESGGKPAPVRKLPGAARPKAAPGSPAATAPAATGTLPPEDTGTTDAAATPGAAEPPDATGASPPDDGEVAVADRPGATRTEPADVARFRSQAAAGNVTAAVRGLEALRKREPKRAEVRYALGNLYAELQSWLPSVEAYAAALTLDPAYRGDARLIGDVVEALGSDRAHLRAAKIIQGQLGAGALPRLEQATRSSSPQLRARARRLRALMTK